MISPFTTKYDALAIPKQKVLSTTMSIGLFAFLTAVGAQIIIPLSPVPFTLQTLFVLLSGAFLGARKGAAAQIAYLVAGAAGLPVFAGFSGTALHFIGPTGGYLMAFPLAAFITGYIVHDVPFLQRAPGLALSMLGMTAAMVLVFVLGVSHLNILYLHNWSASFTAGFLTLQIWDVVKIAAAAGMYSAFANGPRKETSR